MDKCEQTLLTAPAGCSALQATAILNGVARLRRELVPGESAAWIIHLHELPRQSPLGGGLCMSPALLGEDW